MRDNSLRKTILALLCVMCATPSYADENQPESNINVYTFFVNIVNENFKFPLVGFVNIATGSHNLPQIGFVNLNQNDFNGFQAGFVNMVGGDFGGMQMGFVNAAVKSARGAQIGFVNTAASGFGGAQVGFVSTAAYGFDGAQVSFVNIAKKINGIQLGFVNYAEGIESGIPLGFVSIVRDGGYKAVELGIGEAAAVNVAFKIGVGILYTSINVSYGPKGADAAESMLTGMGLGSMVAINGNLFFNPELVFMNTVAGSTQSYLSLAPNFEYFIVFGLSVSAGPSITWAHAEKDRKPFFSIVSHKIDERNSILLGARVALRWTLF